MGKSSSYGQILKSSSIIGGAQVINMVIGLVRAKLVAVLIGPSGVGLLGIFQAITGLTSTIAGLGIQTSGVREVSKFYSSGDMEGTAKTIRTLRRVCWFTGVAGMLLLAAFAPWISEVSFGVRDYAWPIVALGITILLGNISGGQSAIIQGTRRIGDIARISILGAIVGTIISFGFYFYWGVDGIVPALIAISCSSLAISTYYASKISLTEVCPTWKESWQQSKTLLAFGMAMVLSGVASAVVAYLTRVLVTREFGLQGAGIYSAAFSLSGMFVQFVLGAMAADFYPRLTAASGDHIRMGELINEQTEVGLLLAFPGLLATLAFAPYAITVIYTEEFSPASGMLKWFIIGCMGRVISWPLGFSFLSKGQSKTFATLETLFNVLHLGLIWVGMRWFGLNGIGVAYAIMYLLLTVSMLILTRNSIGFAWSRGVRIQLTWMIPMALLIFLVVVYSPSHIAILLGITASLTSSVISLRQLVVRLGMGHRISRTILSMPGVRLLLYRLI